MIFYGAGVKNRRFKQRVDHYSLLATIEGIYHLPRLGASAQTTPMRFLCSQQPVA